MLSQPSPRALPARPGGAVGTPGAHCACAGVLASRARAFPSSAWRGGKASPGAHASIAARPPPCGQGNPHTPQCALGAGWGNRLKPEWGLLRRWRGRESERGLPVVPAPALAVALATGRAGRSEGERRPQGSRATLRLRGARCLWPGFPLVRPGDLRWGGEAVRRGEDGCLGRRLPRREGLWRRGGW